MDREGNVVKERLKVVAPQEQVGDKFVITTTKVVKDVNGEVKKTVRDRVYQPTAWKGTAYDDQEVIETGMECIGKRQVGERIKKWIDGILHRKSVQTNNRRLITTYDEFTNGKIREKMYKDKDFVIDADGELDYVRHSLDCNKKGLPKPKNFLDFGTEKTLKDMRTAFQEKYPGDRYAPSNFSFSSFDEHLPEVKLTDLDKYL